MVPLERETERGRAVHKQGYMGTRHLVSVTSICKAVLGENVAGQALTWERVWDAVYIGSSHSGGLGGPPPGTLDSLGALWCNIPGALSACSELA